MNKGILIIVLLTVVGCVTNKSYVQTNSPKNEIYLPINKNGVAFDFNVSSGDDKSLIITLYFDPNFKQQKIKDITFDIKPNDKSSFVLNHVQLYYVVKKNYKEAVFTKRSSFESLPGEFRMTNISGDEVDYHFDYRSNEKIRARFLKIVYSIELEDTSVVSGTLDLKLHKSHRFAIH